MTHATAPLQILRPPRHGGAAPATALVAIVALAVIAAIAGIAGALVPDRVRSARSEPFSVGFVPEGYEIVTAGAGTQAQNWGDDSTGTDEPFTVLAADGESATSPRAVVVSVTGFAGYEGGLDQASGGYGADTEHFRVDGRDAIYTPPGRTGEHRRWADLVVARERDLAVRVTSRRATRQELVDIERRVRVADDHSRAPRVPQPPNGLRVIGSNDVDALFGLGPAVSDFVPVVPGTARTHSVAWIGGERRSLAVTSIPRRAASLAALRALPIFGPWSSYELRSVRVGKQDGVLVNPPAEGGYRRAIAFDAPWGDVVVVTTAGPDLVSEEDLLAVARSVHRTDRRSWDEFVARTTGPISPMPDADAMELARGRIGDLEWLFQARPAGNVPSQVSGMGAPDAIVADPCLKLSTRRRMCPIGGSMGGLTETIHFGRRVPSGPMAFPGFVVVTTPNRGATLRVQTKAGVATGPLYELPGGRFAGLVFIDEGGLAGCLPFTADTPATFMRVDVLDERGAESACLGFPPPR